MSTRRWHSGDEPRRSDKLFLRCGIFLVAWVTSCDSWGTRRVRSLFACSRMLISTICLHLIMTRRSSANFECRLRGRCIGLEHFFFSRRSFRHSEVASCMSQCHQRAEITRMRCLQVPGDTCRSSEALEPDQVESSFVMTKEMRQRRAWRPVPEVVGQCSEHPVHYGTNRHEVRAVRDTSVRGRRLGRSDTGSLRPSKEMPSRTSRSWISSAAARQASGVAFRT